MTVPEEITYEFGSTDGGDETGFNDPVSTAYKGNIAYYLARESLQNIIDAKDSAVSGPALAKFSVITISSNDLPDYEKLKKIFIACRNYYSDNADCVRFFKRAVDKLENNGKIKLLKISDYNTTGLTGDDAEQNGNYYAFLKAVGSSSKTGGKGGSFGLGKGAFFNASSFRMIFVSSVFDEKCVFQGKLRLVSHLWDKDQKQGNGSYGKSRQKPIREEKDIPEMFRRKEQGTDIYIVDFEDSDKWADQIGRSVLDNFWCAILKKLLIVDVNGVVINADNLEEYMNLYFPSGRTDINDESGPLPYFYTYTRTSVIQGNLPTLGRVSFYIQLNKSYPRRVACIRKNGMVIEHKRFDFISGYAGVFVCEDNKGNEILRKMENEQHSEWKKDNAKGTVYEKEATKADKELKHFIKESLNKMKPSESGGILKIPDLERYLYLPGDDAEGNSSETVSGRSTDNPSEKETGKEIGTVGGEAEEIKQFHKINVINKDIEEGTKGGELPIKTGGGGGGQKGAGGSEGPGEQKVVVLTGVKYRSFAGKKDSDIQEHILIIKGPKNIGCDLELRAGTDDSFDRVNILQAEDFHNQSFPTDGSRIKKLKFDGDGNIKLKLIFDTNDRYSLNLTAYENK